MESQKLIQELMNEGVLVTPEILKQIEEGTPLDSDVLSEISDSLKKKIYDFRTHKIQNTNTHTNNTTTEQNTHNQQSTTQAATQTSSFSKEQEYAPIKIVKSYDKPNKKKTYDHFVSYWRHRFNGINKMLRGRQELQGITSISRIIAQKEGSVALIGMISEKTETKNGNYILTLEDLTGEITVIVTQKDTKLHEQAKNLVLDEVIGVTGSFHEKAVFADKILHPDVPLSKELKKQREEEYMVVVGDPQVGGKEFLYKEWDLLAQWLRGELGTDAQKAIAKKTKYIMIVGDLVEGVGIYPGQEEDLAIPDITKQYEEFARILSTFPKHMHIVCCPGNHDAGRIAEPQPPLYKDFAAALYAMPNVTIVSNPGLVTVGATKSFVGFDVLLYHGYSLIYYSDNIPAIRNSGGQKATDRIMKFLLQRRHLAPTHGCNRYIPDFEEDPLIIDRVPDFFFTGHIHRIATANYRNVTMINAGAWTDITEEQLKRGLEPQPARLPIINLQTRQVTVMNFYQGELQL